VVEEGTKSELRLWPALVGMTALQGIVAIALFAPGVLAPRLGIAEGNLSVFAFSCFATGMICALQGGVLVGALGPFRVAAFCMAAVCAAMLIAGVSTGWSLVLAGLVLGFAFGPETPASSALLGRLARPEQRPVVFSVRQTGNQIGAMVGSLTLPGLALIDPKLGYAAVATVAIVALVVFLAMSRHYDAFVRQPGAAINLRKALGLLRDDPRILRLAVISVPLSAMQLGLNAFFVTFLVGTLAIPHLAAGVVLGVAQAGGLVGRLFWGLVASRFGTASRLIAFISIATAAFAIAIAALPTGCPLPATAMLAFGFGLTASGWNGVFLAEVARCAPEGRMAEATGAVLTASYAGLMVGPVMISILAAAGGLRLSFVALAALCFVAGFLMLMHSDD